MPSNQDGLRAPRPHMDKSSESNLDLEKDAARISLFRAWCSILRSTVCHRGRPAKRASSFSGALIPKNATAGVARLTQSMFAGHFTPTKPNAACNVRGAHRMLMAQPTYATTATTNHRPPSVTTEHHFKT